MALSESAPYDIALMFSRLALYGCSQSGPPINTRSLDLGTSRGHMEWFAHS